MNWSFVFICNSILLGIGLAMDAFSMSLANGLNEPKMKLRRVFLIAEVFAIFQALMPMFGWICVHTIAEHFKAFEKMIPWIALILLGFIGEKMIAESKSEEAEEVSGKLTFSLLMVQGVATSIDALSVGFTISDYNFLMALVCAIIIAVVTFVICVSGVIIGKTFGTKLAGKASVFGGIILILIGVEIFIKGVF